MTNIFRYLRYLFIVALFLCMRKGDDEGGTPAFPLAFHVDAATPCLHAQSCNLTFFLQKIGQCA